VNAPKPRLLFVEDEATLREHLAERLSDEYIVDTAGNGNDALLAVMRAKPALVVTDIVMPDMDGVELLKTLRQSPGTRSIPVLLISGRAPEEQRIEGFEEGADGFLAKPYTERELRALLARCCAPRGCVPKLPVVIPASTPSTHSPSFMPVKSNSARTNGTSPPRWSRCGACRSW